MPGRSDIKKPTQSKSNPYKISTIVLSVLIFIILVSIVAYVMYNILRRKLTKQHNGSSGSDEIPFCAETDGEPEM
jgi:flagellar basal body-associated protein FliL